MPPRPSLVLLLSAMLVALLAGGVLGARARDRAADASSGLTLRLHALPLAEGRAGELLLSNRAMVPVTLRLSSAAITPADLGGWTRPPRWEVACVQQVTLDPWQTAPVCFFDPTTTAILAKTLSQPVVTAELTVRGRVGGANLGLTLQARALMLVRTKALDDSEESVELAIPAIIEPRDHDSVDPPWTVAVDEVRLIAEGEGAGSHRARLRIWQGEGSPRVAELRSGSAAGDTLELGDHALRLVRGQGRPGAPLSPSATFELRRVRGLSDSYCRRLDDCRDAGSCRARGDRCVVADRSDCLGSRGCHLWGRCSARGERCLVASDDDCRGSWLCRQRGWCSHDPLSGWCVAKSDEDCAASEDCAATGHCSLVTFAEPVSLSLSPSWLTFERTEVRQDCRPPPSLPAR